MACLLVSYRPLAHLSALGSRAPSWQNLVGYPLAPKINKGTWIIDSRSNQYFHWLTDAMQRLNVSSEFHEKYPILLTANFENLDFIKDTLKLLNKEYIILEQDKEYLIKDGVLVRGLGGKESQIRSGLDGVANFRASSWNRAPIDRMANINLEPGDSTFDQLISKVENGIFVESNKSWSIDDYRNKFQFGCEYGRLIENGKLTKVVKNPNYRGVSTPFWNSLKGVGNSETFGIYGTPNCGKGEPNQVIRVGHASPACLFDKIQVFGGV